MVQTLSSVNQFKGVTPQILSCNNKRHAAKLPGYFSINVVTTKSYVWFDVTKAVIRKPDLYPGYSTIGYVM